MSNEYVSHSAAQALHPPVHVKLWFCFGGSVVAGRRITIALVALHNSDYPTTADSVAPTSRNCVELYNILLDDRPRHFPRLLTL